MKVHFYSKSSDFEVDFISEAEIIEGNAFDFKDESIENTRIVMIPYEEERTLRFRRYGDTFMDIVYSMGGVTRGYYKNNMGLEFEFDANTLYVDIKKDKIEVEYELYINGELNNHTNLIVEFN